MRLFQLHASYFKLRLRWLPLVTSATYLSKRRGMYSIAACTQLELFRVSSRLVEKYTTNCENYVSYCAYNLK